jgi:ubiquinone/menaquinone biosynthesis C-methylase UbiE
MLRLLGEAAAGSTLPKMKRVVIPELLDDDLGTPDEVRDSLLDLRGINRKFGGFASVRHLIESVARKYQKSSLDLLDVAGGTGDVVSNVSKELADEVQVRATILDRALTHMNGTHEKFARVAGDALSLPFASETFDVVSCNLFLHHLEPEQIAVFFNEGLRVARFAVIASDLRRSRFHWLAAHVGKLKYRSRLTRHDAPVSIRRAYTISEARAMARNSKASSFVVQPLYFQRFGLILWKAPK